MIGFRKDGGRWYGSISVKPFGHSVDCDSTHNDSIAWQTFSIFFG